MRFYPYYEGRDAGRTPMPWTDGPGGGFTVHARPWLPLGDVTAANVAAQRGDPDSVLTLCRDLIAFRRRHPEFASGDYVAAPTPEGVWAWARGERHVVVLNMSAAEVGLDAMAGTVQVCTDRARDLETIDRPLLLPAFQGLILEREGAPEGAEPNRPSHRDR